MLYLFLVCCDEDAFVAPQTIHADTDAWDAQTVDAHRSGGIAGPSREALVVQVRDGQSSAVRRRRTQAVEQIVGFDLLELPNDAAAVEVAAAHPMASLGTIEIRRVLA